MKKIAMLEQLGINETAAKIYLFLLKNKKSTVLDISKGTGIARTNIYHNIENLKNLNLIGVGIEGRKKYFFPESPEKLVTAVKAKERVALDLSEVLMEEYKKNRYESKIKFGYGKEDFKKHALTILNSNEKTVRQFINYDHLKSYGSNAFMNNFWKQRSSANIQARIICSYKNFKQSSQLEAINEIKNIIQLREIKYLPEKTTFDLSIAVFDDTVIFFAPPKEGYMFSFESPAFSDMIKKIHDILWKIAIKI